MNKQIIVPLDMDHDKAIELAKCFNPELCRLKVGNQLFTSSGPKIIEELNALGYEIFLDLKFHDIPNTVYEAVRSAADLGVWMLNVHIAGGRSMLKKAKEALDSYTQPPLLIGVTMLTSLSNEDVKEIGINDISDSILNLASLAKECGLDGVVCSPREASLIKDKLGKDFIAVTPGIRLETSSDDQVRVLTPIEAVNNGSDFLVIGRPITKSRNPLESLKEIITDLNS